MQAVFRPSLVNERLQARIADMEISIHQPMAYMQAGKNTSHKCEICKRRFVFCNAFLRQQAKVLALFAQWNHCHLRGKGLI